IVHRQTIKVSDTTPPTFVGDLPRDITLQEGDNIPIQASLTATDGCSNTMVTHSENREVEGGKVSKVVYTWVATDACGNKTTHKQVITIVPKSSHIPDSASTERREEIRVYNAVSTESGSENYFKVVYTDPNTLISVVIFNEMGLQVYASDHYQENGEIFRGYANVSGVVGTGQRLPSGTYFYILTYLHKGEQEVKKGFLYVK
ncbi:gliding motility-associated C-terminal domain-containing protein, partial [uncultured Capnocytophaga sp.]|uniref:T9SS type B sorting domain-containing protein n=1 Tax=uncultured Capnocytophaga sp. TaxID=159273 RepID=UPI0026373C2D